MSFVVNNFLNDNNFFIDNIKSKNTSTKQDKIIGIEIRQQNKNGDKFLKALEEPALNRFRPIVLTTITTVFGLLPLIFEKSMQAQFLIPMAISLSYGIIMATLLTLLLLPVMLLTLNNIRLFISKSINREDVEPACKELKNNL